MPIKTIRRTGGNFSTLQLWEDSRSANPASDEIAEVDNMNARGFKINIPNSNGVNFIIRPMSGQSYKDQTNWESDGHSLVASNIYQSTVHRGARITQKSSAPWNHVQLNKIRTTSVYFEGMLIHDEVNAGEGHGTWVFNRCWLSKTNVFVGLSHPSRTTSCFFYNSIILTNYFSQNSHVNQPHIKDYQAPGAGLRLIHCYFGDFQIGRDTPPKFPVVNGFVANSISTFVYPLMQTADGKVHHSIEGWQDQGSDRDARGWPWPHTGSPNEVFADADQLLFPTPWTSLKMLPNRFGQYLGTDYSSEVGGDIDGLVRVRHDAGPFADPNAIKAVTHGYFNLYSIQATVQLIYRITQTGTSGVVLSAVAPSLLFRQTPSALTVRFASEAIPNSGIRYDFATSAGFAVFKNSGVAATTAFEMRVTPIAATLITSSVNPTQVATYTPTANTFVGSRVDPTVVTAFQQTTTPVTTIATKVDPTITAILEVTPTPCAAVISKINPTVFLGVIYTPAPAFSTVSKVDPVVTQLLRVTPTPVQLIFLPVEPIFQAAYRLTPTPINAVTYNSPTSVVMQYLLTPNAATLIAVVINPSVAFALNITTEPIFVLAQTIAPTLTFGLSLTPSPLTTTARSLGPSITVKQTPNVVTVVARTLDPTVGLTYYQTTSASTVSFSTAATSLLQTYTPPSSSLVVSRIDPSQMVSQTATPVEVKLLKSDPSVDFALRITTSSIYLKTEQVDPALEMSQTTTPASAGTATTLLSLLNWLTPNFGSLTVQTQLGTLVAVHRPDPISLKTLKVDPAFNFEFRQPTTPVSTTTSTTLAGSVNAVTPVAINLVAQTQLGNLLATYGPEPISLKTLKIDPAFNYEFKQPTTPASAPTSTTSAGVINWLTPTAIDLAAETGLGPLVASYNPNPISTIVVSQAPGLVAWLAVDAGSVILRNGSLYISNRVSPESSGVILSSVAPSLVNQIRPAYRFAGLRTYVPGVETAQPQPATLIGLNAWDGSIVLKYTPEVNSTRIVSGSVALHESQTPESVTARLNSLDPTILATLFYAAAANNLMLGASNPSLQILYPTNPINLIFSNPSAVPAMGYSFHATPVETLMRSVAGHEQHGFTAEAANTVLLGTQVTLWERMTPTARATVLSSVLAGGLVRIVFLPYFNRSQAGGVRNG